MPSPTLWGIAVHWVRRLHTTPAVASSARTGISRSTPRGRQPLRATPTARTCPQTPPLFASRVCCTSYCSACGRSLLCARRCEFASCSTRVRVCCCCMRVWKQTYLIRADFLLCCLVCVYEYGRAPGAYFFFFVDVHVQVLHTCPP